MSLKYKENYNFESGELKIISPIILKSAYSECFKNVLQFLKKGKNQDKELPFDKINNLDEYDSIEINNIKMGFNNVDKTIDFVKNLTMEPPLTNYKENSVNTNDYIFYHGNLKILRTYNIPDVNRVIVDIGPMPNEIFPSDHIPLIADFYIE
jgi:mRNA deadenylase 3'-5' endonuclease subunit Ccr4